MRDIQTVRYVTTHYPRLQGLRLAPLGVPFLLSAAWRAGWLAWWPASHRIRRRQRLGGLLNYYVRAA
jgi:hypothetical protein